MCLKLPIGGSQNPVLRIVHGTYHLLNGEINVQQTHFEYYTQIKCDRLPVV